LIEGLDDGLRDTVGLQFNRPIAIDETLPETVAAD
jgi:hypothetical protein